MSEKNPLIPQSRIREVIQRQEGPTFDVGAVTLSRFKSEFVPLAGATTLLGCSYTSYTRRLLKEGALGGILFEGRRAQWYVWIPSIEAYKASVASRSSLRRIIVWLPEEAVRTAMALLEAPYGASGFTWKYASDEKSSGVSSEPDAVPDIWVF